MMPEHVQAQFNQAAFQQIRLNERIIMNQRLWNFPLSFNEVFQLYNFQVIFNSQCQILSEIWPKLTEGKDSEQEKMLESKEKIEENIDDENIFIFQTKSNGYMTGIKRIKTVNKKNWLKLKSELFNFGNSLMKLMDSKGLGNPNKADPTKSIIDM